MPVGDVDLQRVFVGVTRARNSIRLGHIVELFNRKQILIDACRRRRAANGRIVAGIVQRVFTKSKTADCRDVLRDLQIGQRREIQNQIDVDRRVAGRKRPVGQFQNDKLTTRLAGDDNRVSEAVDGKGMFGLARAVKGQNRGVYRCAQESGAVEGHTIICIRTGWQQQVDVRHIPGVSSGIVECQRDGNVLLPHAHRRRGIESHVRHTVQNDTIFQKLEMWGLVERPSAVSRHANSPCRCLLPRQPICGLTTGIRGNVRFQTPAFQKDAPRTRKVGCRDLACRTRCRDGLFRLLNLFIAGQ